MSKDRYDFKRIARHDRANLLRAIRVLERLLTWRTTLSCADLFFFIPNTRVTSPPTCLPKPGHSVRYVNPLLFSLLHRYRAEQGVALPLSEVRVRVHGHQQGGGPPAPAPEVGLDHGRGLREVHAGPSVRTAGRLRALGQADALPLLELSVRRARAVANDGAQVPAHGIERRVDDTLAP